MDHGLVYVGLGGQRGKWVNRRLRRGEIVKERLGRWSKVVGDIGGIVFVCKIS